MKAQPRGTEGAERATTRPGREMVLFVLVSAAGIYSLGNGLTALSGPNQATGLLWLAVAGVAILILFSQMGRVHDTWTRRPDTKESEDLTAKALSGTETVQTRSPRTGKGQL